MSDTYSTYALGKEMCIRDSDSSVSLQEAANLPPMTYPYEMCIRDSREKVRSLLRRSTQTDEIEENVLSPQDNTFMTELYHLMENELSNPELDVARMTELLKISRTKFYYKVKGRCV